MADRVVGCLHDYTITAGDAKVAADAKAFVINGGGMEAFVEDLYNTNEKLCVIDSSEGIELMCDSGHNHHEESDEHSHEHNSHIWMSVENAKAQVINIKNGLSKEFPLYSEQFEKNCDEYISRLDKLSERVRSAKAQVNNTPVATFHNAYGYLAEEIGLNIVCTVESEEGGEPSAKSLVKLSEEIRRHNVKALFTEPDYEGSAANILASETGAVVYTLNPVIKGDKELTAYEDIMNENIDIILKAVK